MNQVEKNREAMARVYSTYEKNHPEIFNDIEQDRLSDMLQNAIAFIDPSPQQIRALDAGAGTGNVTRHLLQLGCQVTSADLSASTLAKLKEQNPSIKTVTLSGEGLKEIKTDSVDFAVIYSVLHHIEDYAAFVKELVRVVRPGGVFMIDHEHAESYWDSDAPVQAFRESVQQYKPKDWWKMLEPARYYHRLRRMFNPRYQSEGDIHVFPDDHIEWSVVRKSAQQAGAEVLIDEDYLVNFRWYPEELYRMNQATSADMHVFVARVK